jgi:hypothetical protein
VRVVPGIKTTVQATCGLGELVTGGGYYNKGAVAVNTINIDIISRAASITTWEVEVYNYGAFDIEIWFPSPKTWK